MSGGGIDPGKAWTIAARNAAQAGRDPRLLFFAAVLPLLIVFLVGSIFGADASKVPVGVTGGRSGPEAAAIVARLKATGQVKVKHYADLAAVRREVRRGRMSAGLVIQAESGSPVVFVSQRGRVETATARAAVEQAVFGAPDAAGAGGAGAGAGAAIRPVRLVVPGGGDGRPNSAFAYTSASNLVLFTFVNTLAVGGMLAGTRRQGLIERMLATPTSPATIMAGEAGTRFLTAIAQSVGLLAVGTLVFGVKWGHPVGLIAVVLVFAAVSTAAGILFGTVLRTEDQAVPIGAPIGIAMAMLGGCMWSLEAVSPLMRAVGHLTPHAWAMDAFVTLLYTQDSWRSLVAPLAALAMFAGLLSVAAAVNLRRVVVRRG